jgi:hypothetical protein
MQSFCRAAQAPPAPPRQGLQVTARQRMTQRTKSTAMHFLSVIRHNKVFKNQILIKNKESLIFCCNATN